MEPDRKAARPGAKKLCPLLTMRQIIVGSHRLLFWGHKALGFFFKLFVFSVIRSFLFS